MGHPKSSLANGRKLVESAIRSSLPPRYLSYLPFSLVCGPVSYNSTVLQYTNTPHRTNTQINHANYLGNSIKAMKHAVELSLKRLRTTYIDIFYLHYWDYHTSAEEIMNGLHNLVEKGQVLYLVRVSNVQLHRYPCF